MARILAQPEPRNRCFAQRCASKLVPMPRASNLALMKLVRRAEAADPAMLVETFVDAGTLFASLASPDHQILFG